MNPDLIIDMVNEVKEKFILHWNYRGLKELPEEVKDVGTHVQEIYLKWNELKTLPTWISDFTNVTNLYLYGNSIECLPDSLGNMNKLTVLDLSANQLTELPSELGSLKNLKSLLLNQNFISSLPPSMSELENLECLCLSGNRLVALPEWLGSLPSLEELFVDNNLLRELPNRLTLSKSLSMISVCSNNLSYLPLNGFLSVPNIRFDSNPHLNYLSLPVLYQLLSKDGHRLNHESGNVIAYGCFQSTTRTNRDNKSDKLLLVPDYDRDLQKKIEIELPRQLLAVHNFDDNQVISLEELSLRKAYTSRYHHTMDVNIYAPSVHINKQTISDKLSFGSNEYPKPFIQYNLIFNGPVSICVNSYCDKPIFTEAWILFGVRRNVFVIPTIMIFCSSRCARDFRKNSDIRTNHEMYVIYK